MKKNEKIYELFSKLNGIPRASHHEEKVAYFLCQYAEGLGLEYDRDAENCVVIRKPATPGYETAEPVVLLNHMDMVAVGDGTREFDPLKDGIEAYTEDGWMKARGTSLGADNGIGLSMALAVLADDTIAHPALEVLTTTNEEDGMSGATAMSKDFIGGRKVINLDSEDYDTITVGSAGAYLQFAKLPAERVAAADSLSFYKIQISGGLGGHSGVDIAKGRINAIRELCVILSIGKQLCSPSLTLAQINGGDASASIPGNCTAIVGVNEGEAETLIYFINSHAENIKEVYAEEPNLVVTIEKTDYDGTVISSGEKIIRLIANLYTGVLLMRDDIPDTPMTSNNIGIVRTENNHVLVSCHTRSFDDKEMEAVATDYTKQFQSVGGDVEIVMNTPGWQENQDSEYLKLVDQTFVDVLGFSPRKVAMHFVLEAGYYVQKFPGIEIACIGPRIIEPHSTKERVELSTVDNIYKVLIELLDRMK